MSDDETGVYRIIINAPVEKVWAELTRTNTVLPFFFGAKCDTPGLKPGAPVRMRTADGKYTTVVGEVLEFDPPHRYSHSFKFTNLDDPPCSVRYDLKAVEGGTEFTLTNIGVPPGTKTGKYMDQGGVFITQNLKALIETGKATAMGRFAVFMMRAMQIFSPKKCRSEFWP